MIRRLLVVLALFVVPALGTTVQITGTLVDAAGNGLNGTACFKLPVNAIDTSTNRALSTLPLCFTVANGAFPAFASVVPNDVIQPLNTYYQTSVTDRTGAQIFAANYVIPTGGGTFNIGLAIPTVVTTSNISYLSPASLSLTNNWTASQNFNAGLNASQVGAAIHVNNNVGSPYPCTAAGINLALGALPATGGTPGGYVIVDCPSSSSVSLSASINIGTATVPMTLILNSGLYTCAMTSGHCFIIGGSGSHLQGQGDLNTYINCTAGFGSTGGDIIHAEPLGSANSINTVEIDHFRIDQTNCPNNKGINMLSVRDPSSAHHFTDYFYLGNAINVDTSSIASAIISEGIHFSDIFMQSATGTLTASTVTLKGDEIYWGPNNKTVNTNAAGNFSPITISPSAVTNLAEGRRTHIFDSSVSCNSIANSIGILVTGAAGASTGANGNMLGPQINFELCTTGWKLTGPDASHQATNNWVYGNVYLPSTQNLGILDFANANHVMELTNGNVADVTATANSKTNFIDLLLAGSLTDFSNSGTSNLVHLEYLSTGNPVHVFNTYLAPGQAFLGNYIVSGTTTGDVKVQVPASVTGERIMQLADGPQGSIMPVAFTSTAVASEVVTVPGMTASGHCTLFPTNAGAAGGVASMFLDTPATNAITFHHTATSGWTVNIFCTAN